MIASGTVVKIGDRVRFDDGGTGTVRDVHKLGLFVETDAAIGREVNGAPIGFGKHVWAMQQGGFVVRDGDGARIGLRIL